MSPQAASLYRLAHLSHVESRGGRQLLVFGDLPAWLVVDDELRHFLGAFDGATSLLRAVSDHALAFGRARQDVEAEISAVLPALLEQGILGQPETRASEAPTAMSVSNVTINLTNRCNLACPFCYNARRGGDELDVALLCERLHEARRDGLLSELASLIVLGGEPLLEPERLFALLEGSCRAFGRPPLLSTNGTLLDDAQARKLAELGVEVQVSLDSPSRQEHDSKRGSGVYDLAIASVRRLVASGVHAIVCMVYTRHSYRQMEATLDLAASLGVAEARFIPLRTVGQGAIHCQDRPNQLVVLHHLVELLERRPGFRRLLGRDTFSIASAVCRHGKARRSCGIARDALFIDADGGVYPCPNHVSEATRAGDLRSRSLAELFLHSVPMQRARDTFRLEAYTTCKSCFVRHYCAGDCRGEVLCAYGDPLAPSPHCVELKKMYVELMWLAALRPELLDARGRSAGTCG
ncbi:MAG: radical SAM protein [Myxococcota bacterium]|jgi:radical SAM protein with 4Fe4S-binding SPASM domain|nr:radical SAM protein [Myxococcota bacterium]